MESTGRWRVVFEPGEVLVGAWVPGLVIDLDAGLVLLDDPRALVPVLDYEFSFTEPGFITVAHDGREVTMRLGLAASIERRSPGFAGLALSMHFAEVVFAMRARGAVAAWLFGSVAVGLDIRDSDLDFLVKLDVGLRGWDHLAALALIEEDLTRITGLPCGAISITDPGASDMASPRLRVF